MKNKTLLIVFAIMFVFGSIASFIMIDVFDSLFWTGYCSIVVAMIVLFVGSLLTSKNINSPSSYLYITSSILYILSVLVVLYLTIGKIKLNLFVGIEVLMMGIYLVVIVVGTSSHKYIVNQDHDVALHKSNMNSLINMVSESSFDGNEKILEALKYSDPVISNYVIEDFSKVVDEIENLCSENGGDIEKCLKLIKHLNTANKQAKR